MAIQAAQWPKSGGPAGSFNPKTELAPPLPRFDPKNPNPNKNERLGPPENSIESPDFPTIPEPQEILPLDPGIPIPPGPESPTENLPMSLEIPTERFQPEIDAVAIAAEDIVPPQFPTPSDNRGPNPPPSPNDPRFPAIPQGEIPKRRRFKPFAYSSPAVDFDGTTYLDDTTGHGGGSAVTEWMFSCWLNPGSSPPSYLVAFESGGSGIGPFNNYITYNESTASIGIVLNETVTNGAPETQFNVTSSSSLIPDDEWSHVLISYSTVTGEFRLIINGTVDKSQSSVDVLGDFSATHSTVGAYISSPSGTEFDGCLAEVYLHLGAALDLDDAKNVAKFRTSDNRPKYLGPQGEYPTVSQPHIFLGGPETLWNLNLGSGSDFTVTGGSLTGCADAP